METFLLMLAVILVAGVWSARLGNRFGFPVLIGFVAIGVILGPGGFRISPVVPRSMANFVGYIALILILFEGGLHTSVARIRKVWIPALSLATVGVLISSAIMALLAYYLLNLPFFPAALLGVAVSSTDAASVFSILGGQPLRKRLVDVLEVESGTNDPMAFFLTIVLIQWSTHGFGSFWHATWYVIGTFALQMFVGLAVGVGTGYLGSFANQRIKLDTGGLYPTLTLAFAVLLELVAIARENAIMPPVEIKSDSRFVNRRMVDIAFPPNTLCYAIVRSNQVIVPRGATRLQGLDHLLVLSDRRNIRDLQKLFEGELMGLPEFLP